MFKHTTTLIALFALTTGCVTDAVIADPLDDAFTPVEEDPGFVADAPEDEDEDTAIDTGEGIVDDTVEATYDGDTPFDPLVTFTFNPYGNDTLTVTDDVSNPTGDREDWIAFRTVASQNSVTRVDFTLLCLGDTEGLVMEIWDDGGQTPVPTNVTLNCAVGAKDASLESNHDYLARVAFDNVDDAPRYAAYDLIIEN